MQRDRGDLEKTGQRVLEVREVWAGRGNPEVAGTRRNGEKMSQYFVILHFAIKIAQRGRNQYGKGRELGIKR